LASVLLPLIYYRRLLFYFSLSQVLTLTRASKEQTARRKLYPSANHTPRNAIGCNFFSA
jgi:hypothetical protein